MLLKKRTDTLEEYRRHSPEDKRCLDLVHIHTHTQIHTHTHAHTRREKMS